jgi:hypothetical protein
MVAALPYRVSELSAYFMDTVGSLYLPCDMAVLERMRSLAGPLKADNCPTFHLVRITVPNPSCRSWRCIAIDVSPTQHIAYLQFTDFLRARTGWPRRSGFQLLQVSHHGAGCREGPRPRARASSRCTRRMAAQEKAKERSAQNQDWRSAANDQHR